VKEPSRLLDRALLWLHEQEAIRLNKGLAVFRPAMTIRLGRERRRFGREDFAPLGLHYDEQVAQIHVMEEYVRRGLRAMAEALQLAMDYFRVGREEFLRRWLPRRERELARQTTPQSWRAIVESLGNPVQQRIVADEREQASVLVLAGPGAGKTRVLVHRIAYLVRARREHPRGILALAYNRHAALEIRRRLVALIGDDARGVSVLTCHALAMRLAGLSLAGRAARVDAEFFRDAMRQAVALLGGEGLSMEEADEQRARLLAGFRWILVDEYQDMGPEQYALISALAGRSLQDPDSRLALFAVGDDDQNIYSFDGASVEFIRRFAADYAARPVFLTENYRSTGHIIAAANRVIAPARERMKAEHPITVDRARRSAPPGGEWEALDPVSRGRVQILPAGADPQTQAVAVLAELRRLAALDPDWDWARAAVIARAWRYLEPVRAACELAGIPLQMADEEAPQFWRLRETQSLLDWLHAGGRELVDAGSIRAWLQSRPEGPWWALLQEAIEEYALEAGAAELPVGHFTEWLAEWGREIRRRQSGLLLLTAHRAKGLEFEHVVVLDGGWERAGRNEDRDAPRRLCYVAMTRARSTLTLACLARPHPLLDGLAGSDAVLRRAPVDLPPPAPELARHYRRLAPGDVDLGLAGRHGPEHPVHGAIAALQAGDRVGLRAAGGRWELADEAGQAVGRLARGCSWPAGMRCVAAR
jgi:ATP-dependent DNA helicase RecQ